MKKHVRVILSGEAGEAYNLLKERSLRSKVDRSVLNSIDNKVELIKTNPHYGMPVSKKLIPDEYFEKYGITNLFRVELANYWRMLYTLADGESTIEIIAFVLDITDHGRYDRKFGYSKK